MTLYLLKYNNYYNRTIKFKKNINDYLDYMILDNPLFNINFNPNDNVNTEHVVNIPGAIECPDYLVVCDEEDNIISRWFILESVRNRKDQYTLSLRRDLIVDHMKDLIKAPVFIEKATPSSIYNKFIFNKENGLQYNQIKKKEELLKDETNSPWIVGYIASDVPSTTVTVSGTEQTYSQSPISISTLEGYSTSSSIWSVRDTAVSYGFRPWSVTNGGSNKEIFDFLIGYNGAIETAESSIVPPNEKTTLQFYAGAVISLSGLSNTLSTAVKNNQDSLYSTGLEFIKGKKTGVNLTQSQIDILYNMNGNIYEDGGRVFSINFYQDSALQQLYTYAVPKDSGSFSNTMLGTFKSATSGGYDTDTSGYKYTEGFYVNAYVTSYKIEINYISKQAATITINAANPDLSDAPYKMFAIPYNDGFRANLGGTTYTSSRSLAKKLAFKLGTTLGSSLYDLQLLPYCPIREGISSSGFTYNQYTICSTPGGPATFLLWANTSNFSFTVKKEIQIPGGVYDFKIQHETEFCRLCSPNYSGAFEFKPTSNYGVYNFDINCTYKPYQPYIHINPVFKSIGLYGNDFNDQRGLVCGGEFSLPIVNDAWVQYQIQNKSYIEQFQRQIQNMETTYDINRKQTETSTMLSAISAGLAGMTGGAVAGLKGGAAGSIAGGIVGGVGSFAASMYGRDIDLKAMSALHNEATSYARDMYNYNLQNIQALPYTLSKVGAFTINNKIFPFIEFYSASDEEKEALRQKLKYNGFTIMSISTINNYFILPTEVDETFIQGQLIRLEDSAVCDDYHILVELASEIHKGFYIKKDLINGGI